MTREAVIQIISEEITKYGFVPEMEERFSKLPKLKEDEELYIAVNIRERSIFVSNSVTYQVEVKSSIRRMGGNPTPEELMVAADQIRRGAELTKALQNMNLRYLI